MLHRFPTGVDGEKVHQKRLPEGAPDWVRDGRDLLPALWPHRRRALRDRARERDLGGADVDGRVSPLELAPRRRRAARRVADRHRSRCRSARWTASSASRESRTSCSTSSAPSAFRRPVGRRGLHVYVRIPPRWSFGELRRAALAFAREVERRAPDDATTVWWRKDRDPAEGLRRLQSERARPHDRVRLLGPRRARRARSRRRSAGTSSTASTRRELTIATVPERFAELGDLHAGIDDTSFRDRAAARVGRPRRARGAPGRAMTVSFVLTTS